MSEVAVVETANQKLLRMLREKREDKQKKTSQSLDNVIDVVEKADPVALANEVAVPIKSNSVLATSPEYAKVYEDLCSLEQQLVENIPTFVSTLRDIHRAQAQDPNIVTIMTPEEIGVILTGLRKHMAVEVIAPKAKTKSTTARLKNLDDSDI